MAYIELSVINSEEEIKSFPLKQSIQLKASTVVEDSLLSSNIALIREVAEYGLLNVGELYNYNIGYVKQKFSTVPISLEIENDSKGSLITVTPEETLSPNSKYALYIDRRLSEEHVELNKIVSKGPSKLELVNIKTKPTSSIYILEVVSDPFVGEKANVVKLKLYIDDSPDRTFTINAKDTSRNTIDINGLVVKVFDTAYARGEQFEIKSTPTSLALEDNYILPIQTAPVSSIRPVKNIKPSTAVSNQTILDFYKTQTKVQDKTLIDQEWLNSKFRIEYLGDSKAFIHLEDGLTVDNLDLDHITYRIFPAYNRYDLESISKYKEELDWKIKVDVLEQNLLLLEFYKESI